MPLILSDPCMLKLTWVPLCLQLDDETTFGCNSPDSTLRVIQRWRKVAIRMLRRSFTWRDDLVRVLLLRTKASLPLSSPT